MLVPMPVAAVDCTAATSVLQVDPLDSGDPGVHIPLGMYSNIDQGVHILL